MHIVSTDRVLPVPPGTDPDYDDHNPLYRLIGTYERVRLAAEREHYPHDMLQALFPIESLTLYGPREANHEVLDPREQDFVDFQKQNVKEFTLGDTHLVRGWATVDGWTGAFLRVSYRGGPDSRLSRTSAHTLGERIRLHLKVGNVATADPVPVSYNPESDRYEIEFWAYPGQDLRSKLDTRGRAAWDRGELVVRTDLVHGLADEFSRPAIEDKPVPTVSPSHAMHPTRPLRIELAWADESLRHWDSREGRNHVLEFSMVVRGWDHFLKVGTSPNPHGGVGKLEYRNLLSNYFEFQDSGELGRSPAPWSFDAFSSKAHGGRREPFLAVHYMDLHIVQPNAGIGLHRHRDNQEIFMALQDEAVMVVGDWCEMPHRQRAFELRTLRAGYFALLKGGQLHGLLNTTDGAVPLLMFGGYD